MSANLREGGRVCAFVKRFALAAIAVAHFGCVAFGDEREIRTVYVTFIAPESVEEMAAEADVIVRGRVLGSRAFARNGVAPRVLTEHRLQIIEAIHGWIPSDARQKHDEMVLLQHAGEVETENGLMRIADEIPLSPGSEYVLFLTWNPAYEGYEISRGPYGIFRVEHGSVHPASDFRTVKSAKGKGVGQFTDELRRHKKDKAP